MDFNRCPKISFSSQVFLTEAYIKDAAAARASQFTGRNLRAAGVMAR
jgi:hypothetical protein